MLQLPPVQAVLLAGGGGSRLYPLNASGTPKVLLPVANRPLLTFPLRMLEESGVTDVLVVSGGGRLRMLLRCTARRSGRAADCPGYSCMLRVRCGCSPGVLQRDRIAAAQLMPPPAGHSRCLDRCVRVTWRRRRSRPGWQLATMAACEWR